MRSSVHLSAQSVQMAVLVAIFEMGGGDDPYRGIQVQVKLKFIGNALRSLKLSQHDWKKSRAAIIEIAKLKLHYNY